VGVKAITRTASAVKNTGWGEPKFSPNLGYVRFSTIQRKSKLTDPISTITGKMLLEEE
jgi:hypothetical protein